MKVNGISTGTAQPTGLPLYNSTDPVSRQAIAAFLASVHALRWASTKPGVQQPKVSALPIFDVGYDL